LVVGSGVAGSAAALIAAETYRIPVTLLFAGAVPTDCNSYWAQGGIIYRNYNNNNSYHHINHKHNHNDTNSLPPWPLLQHSPQQLLLSDSADLLAADIHRAGAGLCDDAAVRKVATEGPERVRQLLLGTHPAFASVPFDRNNLHRNHHHHHHHNDNNNNNDDDYALCLEASHSAARILHTADHTGRTLTQHITEAALRHPLITPVGHVIVTDLIVANADDGNNNDAEKTTTGESQKEDPTRGNDDRVCIGVETLHRQTGRRSVEYATRGVVLATGGLAGIYQHSTNPTGFNALGSSVGLAVRANVLVRDLEFVQFHPTALYAGSLNQTKNATTANTTTTTTTTECFLLTEALRGEGAILRDASGRAFAREYHPDGELAPRDIVARAVFAESQKITKGGGADLPAEHNVFLDITHRDRDWLHQRFPSIQAHLQQYGLDLARDRLPIVPAAHYTCGGVQTDLHGATSLPGLFAAGEAARTGLHGGNRLASTSLLEGLVFGASVADFVGAESGQALRERTMQALETKLASAASVQSSGSRTHSSSSSSSSSSSNRLEPVHIENAAQRAMQLLKRLRRIMWDHVGVVRTPSGLATAHDELSEIKQAAFQLHAAGPTLETAAVRDAACAGLAVTQAALANRTSVGAHCIVADAAEHDEEEAPLAAAAR